MRWPPRYHYCPHRQVVLYRNFNIATLLAVTVVIASFVVSCGNKLGETSGLLNGETPMQSIEDMFAVQTSNGNVQMRMEAKLMEHFVTDSGSYDAFPKGLAVFSYTDEGLLESIIVADKARHNVPSDKSKDELWAAYGDVIIHNVINQQTMETDTIYWDQTKQEIYTDSYVKMYTKDDFMQGYGMRSDDHARNAILHNPFDGYAKVVQDTTAVIIDSVNFIGPFPKK